MPATLKAQLFDRASIRLLDVTLALLPHGVPDVIEYMGRYFVRHGVGVQFFETTVRHIEPE